MCYNINMDKQVQSNEGTRIIGEMRFTIADAKTGKVKKVYLYKNLVVTVGRANIAQRIASDNANSLNVNFGALGTDPTGLNNANIKLGVEIFRKAISSFANSSNQAFLSFFYGAGEGTATIKEFGTFIDATITPDSGVLLSRVIINVIKTATDTLTVDVTYTVT